VRDFHVLWFGAKEYFIYCKSIRPEEEKELGNPRRQLRSFLAIIACVDLKK